MLILEDKMGKDELSCKPSFFRIYFEEDKSKLTELIRQNPNLQICDQISTQLDDLVKSKNPELKKPDRNVLDQLKQKHMDGRDLQEYGVWVYYPWNNTLVHCLDEEEFVEVRTNRNRYKITREEQAVLSSKKIGIIGLSVGQSIALTIAMERTCGELRLADFDTAELSNLNRLRTGIQNIGIHKTVIAAREIAEIDPFLKVVIFNDGLHKDNIDSFFIEGGHLDLLVEVCDGLDIKIESRFKARELKIPVVMDTNDRGMLDVERFDLEPERPVLHGLAEGLDPKNIKDLTNEEKIPFILNMIGAEKISTRLKASMLEVEQSLNTWPQLASSVVLGGALTTDVSRRILLDQFHDSGRYYIDFEDLVKDKVPAVISTPSLLKNPFPALEDHVIMEVAENYLNSGKKGFEPDKETLDSIINAAMAAPSAGNSQPWKLYFKDGMLFLFHDKQRSWSWGDYFEMGAHMGLGTLLENIDVQGAALNLTCKIELFPLKHAINLTAVISFAPNGQPADLEAVQRAKHIFKRYTNRKLGERKTLSAAFYSGFIAAAMEIENMMIFHTEDEKNLAELADIIAECDKVRLLNQLGHEEFYHEIRWTPAEAERTRDGIELRAVDISASEIAGFKVAKDWNALKLIADWKKGNAFKKLSLQSVKSASSIIIFTIPEFNHLNLLNAGRSVQKAWLYASQQGVSVYPMLSPAFFFNRMTHGKGIDLSEEVNANLHTLRTRFLKVFPEIDAYDRSEVFIMKVGIADDIGVRSLRRDKSEIFINTPDA
jgi:hypothetical protein